MHKKSYRAIKRAWMDDKTLDAKVFFGLETTKEEVFDAVKDMSNAISKQEFSLKMVIPPDVMKAINRVRYLVGV